MGNSQILRGRLPELRLGKMLTALARPEDRSDWMNAGMTEWRLIGPDLPALILKTSVGREKCM